MEILHTYSLSITFPHEKYAEFNRVAYVFTFEWNLFYSWYMLYIHYTYITKEKNIHIKFCVKKLLIWYANIKHPFLAFKQHFQYFLLYHCKRVRTFPKTNDFCTLVIWNECLWNIYISLSVLSKYLIIWRCSVFAKISIDSFMIYNRGHVKLKLIITKNS